MIYHEALTIDFGPITGLVPPPLQQANSKVRDEAMPVYYTENTFKVFMPHCVGDWQAFRSMCHDMIATGGLKFITSLDLVSTCLNGMKYLDERCYKIRFRFQLRRDRQRRRHRVSIGDRTTNWGDFMDVAEEYRYAIIVCLGEY